MGPLCGSALFDSISSPSPSTTTAKPSSQPCCHSTTIPYRRSLQYYKDQRQIEKAQRNQENITSFSKFDAAVLPSPAQPSGPPPTKLPTTATSSSHLYAAIGAMHRRPTYHQTPNHGEVLSPPIFLVGPPLICIFEVNLAGAN
ncbi:hypothetical protein L208DRAFT_343202 [Tricholoma matsutake]|nr:hypothetical protein L208DRAFT_343202 [Tricholoma matsutake 945]